MIPLHHNLLSNQRLLEKMVGFLLMAHTERSKSVSLNDSPFTSAILLPRELLLLLIISQQYFLGHYPNFFSCFASHRGPSLFNLNVSTIMALFACFITVNHVSPYVSFLLMSKLFLPMAQNLGDIKGDRSPWQTP